MWRYRAESIRFFCANADWKGFNLNVSFLYQLGGQVYNQTLVDRVEDADLSRNVDERVLKADGRNRVIIPFLRTLLPETGRRLLHGLYKMKCIAIQVVVSILSFPQKWIKKMYMERMKLTFQMEDLFRISTVKRERGWIIPLPGRLILDYRYSSDMIC